MPQEICRPTLREKSADSCPRKQGSGKKTLLYAESTGQKLSGAFRSYPHLGHGLSQRQILVKRLNVNRIKAGSAKFELLYSKKNAL